MKPHEQQAIDDRESLIAKIDEVWEFYDSDAHKEMSEAERLLLDIQMDAMDYQIKALNLRINMFSEGVSDEG